MKKSLNNSQLFLVALSMGLAGCAPTPAQNFRVPAVEYANRLKQQRARIDPEYRKRLVIEQGFNSIQGPGVPAEALYASGGLTLTPNAPMSSGSEPRAMMKMVSDNGGTGTLAADKPAEAPVFVPDEKTAGTDVVTNLGADNQSSQMLQPAQPLTRDYNGPLSLGDPGLQASLWRESSTGTSLFRDYRAWQPMDLITIVVLENSEGKNKADTTIKQESTVTAAIKNFLGLEKYLTEANKNIDLNNLINANSSHDYKGEGETKRTGALKATISAMVAEVLPSGVLRIEGEKIIVVNNEDEVMKISGLVRPEDVSSRNEVDSSKVANVRIDYYGKGSVGNAQTGGWLGNLVRKLWPL